MEAARESDAAPAAEEALDFDDVTLKGEKKRCKCWVRHLQANCTQCFVSTEFSNSY